MKAQRPSTASAKAYLQPSSEKLTESSNGRRRGRPRLSAHLRIARRFESTFSILCKETGRKYARQGYYAPFDYLVDGWRVELKVAALGYQQRRPIWKFNIHRHNVLNERMVDFYILRLQNVPFTKHALHLLIKAPIKRKVLQFTVRILMDGAGLYGKEYHRFMHGEFGQGPHPLPEAQ